MALESIRSRSRPLDDNLQTTDCMEGRVRKASSRRKSQDRQGSAFLPSSSLHSSLHSGSHKPQHCSLEDPPIISPTSVIDRRLQRGCIDSTSHSAHPRWTASHCVSLNEEDSDDDSSCCSFGDDESNDLERKVSWKGLDKTIEIERLEDSGAVLGDLFYTTDEIEVARQEAYLESCEELLVIEQGE